VTRPSETGNTMRHVAGYILKLAKRSRRYNKAAQDANMDGDRVKTAYLLGKQAANQVLETELLTLMASGKLSEAEDVIGDETVRRRNAQNRKQGTKS
jgi:hypothetical protein